MQYASVSFNIRRDASPEPGNGPAGGPGSGGSRGASPLLLAPGEALHALDLLLHPAPLLALPPDPRRVPTHLKEATVREVPLASLKRPLERGYTGAENDPDKVRALMESIAEVGQLVPIDVLEVDGELWSFSGCHRYEAHRRLGLETIRVRVIRSTREALRHHLS